MSDSKNQSRPVARHRGEPARKNKSRSTLRRAAANLGPSQRMAVFAGVVAVFLGAGAATQAAGQAISAQELSRTSESRTVAEHSAAPSATATPSASASAKPSAAPTQAPAPAPAAVAPQAAAPAAPVAPPAPAAPAAPVAVDDPAGAQAYAASMLSSYGWGQGEMSSLITLWNKESDWRTTATNASSGAYGIVQSLPGEKMASEGADWQTNYQTQIRWGLNYIKERYGSPSAAWAFHLAHNWY
ncbi:aggregation-promoting factor C-terminal-like domain-containing protein [Arthrobacter sp. MMS24-S77]